MSKRKSFTDFYSKQKSERNTAMTSGRLLNQVDLQKSVTGYSLDDYSFKGTATVDSVVVRCDLNGYSKWAAGRTLKDRADLLDDFFSVLVIELKKYQGVYFRDEGDCMVAIFSSYFDSGFKYSKADSFCTHVTRQTYGDAKLSAKTIVSCGSIAIFQKNHEIGTDDWSAEGEPFVRAARVEQAAESKQRIYFFKKDFDRFFRADTSWVQPGGRYYWSTNTENIQIPGLGLVGGWEEMIVQEYIPGGRI